MSTDVLFLSRFNAFCGVSTYTEQLATALSSKHVDVGALSSDFKTRRDCSEVPCIVGWSEDGDLEEAVEAIIELDPKIVHLQHENGIFRDTVALSELCDEIRIKTNARLVMTAHTIPRGLPRHGHDFWRLIRRMDAVIVHSMMTQQIVSRYTNIKNPEKVHFIPHGMLDFVPPMDRAVACKQLGLDPSENIFRLLSMGFISNNKRHMAMLQIVGAIVSHERLAPKTLELVIGGQAADDAKGLVGLLKKNARSLEIEKNVHVIDKFIPFDQLPYYYGSADMAIHMTQPSHLAASGSMRTDLSHGLPIIALQSNMTFDVGRSVLKVGSPAEMMTRLYQVSRDHDDTLKVMRDQTRSFTKQHRWSKIAAEHLALYEKVCGETLRDQRDGVRSALFHSSPWMLGRPR